MPEPVTSTDRGGVRGIRTSHGYAFRGIPFAKAPFGPLRFRAPERTDAWDGARPATTFAPTAPQPESGFTLIPEPTIDGGEAPECLSLNVFTPDLGEVGLPVLVWIHGGGFVTGTPSSSWYDGDSFARDGVVVVSVGYRLGAEGFLSVPGATSNRAVLDWIAALEWVQCNVAFFGGDPGRVTVAGQSAGGAATMLLATLPRAEGLFRAAVPMSGSVFPAPSPEASLELTERIARQLGIAATLADFERVSAAALVGAQVAATSASPEEIAGRGLPFSPIVDGDVVPEAPKRAIANGASFDVPLLIGTTSEEFTAMGRFAPLDDDGARERLAALGLTDEAASYYRTHSPDPGDQVGQAISDRTFKIPALRVAEARLHAPAPTFRDEFSWQTPALGGLGAVHCLDLPFWFDVLEDDHAKLVAGEGAPQELADDMHTRWVAFVTDNDPGWAPFTDPGRTTMVFGMPSGTIDDLHHVTGSLWR